MLNSPSTIKAVAFDSARHLNQVELSRRWRISPRTLERWRWLKEGPTFLKIGGRVVYKLEDVEQYEAAQRHVITNKARHS